MKAILSVMIIIDWFMKAILTVTIIILISYILRNKLAQMFLKM
jgi:hypothetical protein